MHGDLTMCRPEEVCLKPSIPIDPSHPNSRKAVSRVMYVAIKPGGGSPEAEAARHAVQNSKIGLHALVLGWIRGEETTRCRAIFDRAVFDLGTDAADVQ